MTSNCNCVICGKPIYKIPSRMGDHPLCSYACRNKYFSGEKSFAWKGGYNKEKRFAQMREAEKTRRIIYKKQAVDMMGGKCVVCGYSSCLAALEFHHVNPQTKNKSIKDMICGKWNRIKQELVGCVLLCANCHRMIHWRAGYESREYKDAIGKISTIISAT